MISSSSPWVKIQIMVGKICLRCKDKTLLGFVNKLLKTKSLLTMPSPSNVLPLHLKQTILPIIWIFTQGEGDQIQAIFLNLFYFNEHKTIYGWEKIVIVATGVHARWISIGINCNSGIKCSLIHFFWNYIQNMGNHFCVRRSSIENKQTNHFFLYVQN